MNNQHLKKTLQLIRRTGDRGIIIDEESDELFVLMDVKAYEKLLSPVDGPLQHEEPQLEEPPVDFGLNDLAEVEESPLGRGRGGLATVAPVISTKKAPPVASVELNFSEDWTPTQSSASNEESLADVPHDGEEEEKFYLEPVG
ncbi:MAG: hypothetical protein AAB467_02120 [Patescibacteria group bacterium]